MHVLDVVFVVDSGGGGGGGGLWSACSFEYIGSLRACSRCRVCG